MRLALADGRFVEAAIRRRPGATGRIDEHVRCERGGHDLRRPADAPHGDRHPLRVAMAALVQAIRTGRRVDHGPWLWRATLAAVAGRSALETGSAVGWETVRGRTPGPA